MVPRFRTRTASGGFCLLLVVLSFVYFHEIADHPLQGHDEETFRDNVAISENFSYLLNPRAERELASGRPVAELVKWVGFLIVGNDASWFHVLVVMSHATVALLVALMAIRLGMDQVSGYLGGILFLINSAHFEVVYWISAIDYSIALIFGILAILCFQRFHLNRRSSWLLVFYLAMAGGVLAHPSVGAVWFFCFYLHWIRERNMKTTLKLMVPLALLLLISLVLAISLTRQETSTWDALHAYTSQDALSLIIGCLRMFLWFAGRLLTTAHWILVTPYELSEWEFLVGAATVAGLIFLIVNGTFPGALWSVWIVATLLPFVALTEPVIYASTVGPARYLYLSTVGASLLLAWFIRLASIRLARKRQIWGLVFFGTVLLGIMSSSYGALKKCEALSFYASGRTYIADADDTAGIVWLKRSIAQGRDIIPLRDAYYRLCNMLIANGSEVEPFLTEARMEFPRDSAFDAVHYALESLHPAPDRRQLGMEIMKHAYQVRSEFQTEDRKAFNAMISAIYHNIGNGMMFRNLRSHAVEAYQMSLLFDSTRTQTAKALSAALEEKQVLNGPNAIKEYRGKAF